jgi:hypothetical protein
LRTYQGTTRPINKIDIERFPELEAVLDAWRACDSSALDDLESSPFAPFLDDLVLVEAHGEGEYLYLHYGQGISTDAGISMVGKSTSEFSSDIGRTYAEIYDTSLRSKRVMYSVNRASVTHTAHSWLRVIMPFPAKRGKNPARLVALVKRLVWVKDILAELARDTGFFGGTLEPVLE